MKKYPKFMEYLNSKGKLQEKPTVDPAADQLDTADSSAVAKSPPKAVTSGKGWKIEVPSNKEAPKPYRAPGVPVKPKTAETGFADKGSIPAWNPSLATGNSQNLPGGKDVDGGEWAGKSGNTTDKHRPKEVKPTKTESFIKKTKGMDIKQFTEYMMETCGCGHSPTDTMPPDTSDEGEDSLPMVTAYTAGKFHPHPPEAIRYVITLANKNDRVLENLIQELKRGGGLKKLIKALMDDHPESYDSFTDLLDDDEGGDQRANALARAMSEKMKHFTDMFGESVVPPFGFEDEDGDDSDDGADSEEESIPDDDEGGPGPDDGDEDSADGNVPPPMKMDDEGDGGAPPMPPPRKRKIHGVARLLKALDRYENMASYMRSCMSPM